MDKGTEAHGFTLTARKDLSVSGVKKVDSFDDKVVVLVTAAGPLVIKGENLHIRHLDLEQGVLLLDGIIAQLTYQEPAPGRRGRILERLVR